MTDDDYDALSQKQLASIKRDMRISLEDAAVRATYKVMAELAQPEQEPVATLDDLEQEIYENTRQFVSRDVMEWMLKRYYTTPPQRTWVGLTDEEIEEVERWVEFKEEGSGRIPMGKLVTYISEKLRIKNT